MASVSRDRALQAERRKKATAFIRMKAVPKPVTSGATPTVAAETMTTTTVAAATPEKREETERRGGSRRRDSEDSGRGRSKRRNADLEEGEIRKHKSKKRKSHKRLLMRDETYVFIF